MKNTFIKKDNLTELIDIVLQNPEITQNPSTNKPQQVISNDGEVVTLELNINNEDGILTIDRQGKAVWEPYIEVVIEVTNS
jgi:hypothetical protein